MGASEEVAWLPVRQARYPGLNSGGAGCNKTAKMRCAVAEGRAEDDADATNAIKCFLGPLRSHIIMHRAAKKPRVAFEKASQGRVGGHESNLNLVTDLPESGRHDTQA